MEVRRKPDALRRRRASHHADGRTSDRPVVKSTAAAWLGSLKSAAPPMPPLNARRGRAGLPAARLGAAREPGDSLRREGDDIAAPGHAQHGWTNHRPGGTLLGLGSWALLAGGQRERPRWTSRRKARFGTWQPAPSLPSQSSAAWPSSSPTQFTDLWQRGRQLQGAGPVGFYSQAPPARWGAPGNPAATTTVSIHDGDIGDIGRLVRVEFGDLRLHPLAAFTALSAPRISSSAGRLRSGRAQTGPCSGQRSPAPPLTIRAARTTSQSAVTSCRISRFQKVASR